MARMKSAPNIEDGDQAVMDGPPLSRRVLVEVKRDQTTTTPLIVWQHEIPILEAIFGEGAVESLPPETMDEGYSPKAAPELMVHNKRQDAIKRPSDSVGLGHVFIGSQQAEYDRLASVYGWHPDVKQTYVENVYDRFARGHFKIALGEPRLDDLPVGQLRELVLQYGYQIPAVDFNSGDAERAAAKAAADKLAAMTQPQLVALARQLGVQIGG